MISAFDKELGREVLKVLKYLYEDRPNNWDAWDIDFFYRKALARNKKFRQNQKGKVSFVKAIRIRI